MTRGLTRGAFELLCTTFLSAVPRSKDTGLDEIEQALRIVGRVPIFALNVQTLFRKNVSPEIK